MRSLEAVGLLALLVTSVVSGCKQPTPTQTEVAPRTRKVVELAPAEDRGQAPHTGWTRAHYEAVFARTLLGFVDNRSEAGARTRYPGGEQLPAAMEGATRMLPALGAWLACPCNPDVIVVDGRELDVVEIARTIVVAGTNPKSPDYWKKSPGGWDQREVEAASVAEFLVRSRARIWDRLTLRERDRIMAWLGPAEPPLAANWLAFQIARNGARLELGYPAPRAALDAQLDGLWRNYAGDGFFNDGHRHRFDWYNAFVVHAELSFWRSLASTSSDSGDAERVARFARATELFLAHLPYLFDAQGRVAPLGRSLAYRSAVLAGLHASILADDGFIDPGLARRISAGNLRYHVEAGAFGPDEVLTRGYQGEQPDVLENYLRPGSQYFFTRALSVLALPPEHEFWTAKEQPLPADLGDFVHAIPAVGWMLAHDADGSGLILHNAGTSSTQRKYYDKYAKLGYPAATWYAKSGDSSWSYDAMVVNETSGRFNRRRSDPHESTVAPGFAWTRYSMAAEIRDAEPHWITTATLADPGWVGPLSLRLSCIDPSKIEPTRLYEGSQAIALGLAPREDGGFSGRGPWMYLDSGPEAPRWGAGAVLLAGLRRADGGDEWQRLGRELDLPEPAKHALGGPAGFVGLGTTKLDTLRCFASVQALAPTPFEPGPILTTAPEIAISDTRAEITGWAGTQAWVELARDPSERTLELGPVRASGPLRLLWVGRVDDRLRVVAVGVRELADELGPLLRATEPRTIVACEFGPQRTTCELDGPVSLRRPGRDTEWTEVAISLERAKIVTAEIE